MGSTYGRFWLVVDGERVASGSSCFSLGLEGWARMERGASSFEVWSRRKGRAVSSWEWSPSWRRPVLCEVSR